MTSHSQAHLHISPGISGRPTGRKAKKLTENSLELLVNNSLSHKDLNMAHNAGPASSNPYSIEGQEKLSLLRIRVSHGALQHSENVSSYIMELLWSQLDEAAHVLSGLWGPCTETLNPHFSELQPQQQHYILHP